MQLTYLTAALAAITTAYAIDASATPSSSGAVPSSSPPSKIVDQEMFPTSSGQILLNYDKECYIELTDIQGCTGRSKPFGTVSKSTGNCDNKGAYPLVTDICDGQIWIYTHGKDNEETIIPPLGKGSFVTEGQFWFKNSTGHVNEVQYNMGYVKPGCEFHAKRYDGDKLTWDGSCYA
ncbi:uncharacterized protein KD926_004080 [Aspergillus affinis]|uniref:uncharacterized protein n=1 Tax=Aspergillus affinis TaxID=1070780 RepID=UPI0022FEDED2|nr:uncharacterized protein KD926_004080 [Aspergillus affinis]KAI9046242.1 hypothetical protein KD926_004080 [Aspergillus affinis]